MILDVVEGQKSEGRGGPEMAKIHYGVKISRKQRGPKMPKFNMGQNRTSLNVPTTAQHKHTTTHNNTILEDWPNWLAQNGGSTETGFLPVFAFFFFFFLSKSKNPKNWPKSKWGWV